MKSTKFPLLLLSVISLLGLTACPAKPRNSHDGSYQREKLIFVQGDPMRVLQGAQTHPRAPFTKETIGQLADFYLVGAYGFVEKSEVENGSHEENMQVAFGKQSENTDLKTVGEEYRVAVSFDNEQVSLTIPNKFSLGLAVDDANQLQATNIKTGSSEVPYKILHWSVTPQKDLVSLLIHFREPGNSMVLALYFALATPMAELRQVDPKYLYMAGAGKAVGFSQDQDLELKICGAEQFRAPIENAVNKWQAPLKGRLNMRLSIASQYPPFSDVNQHCIYVLPDYLTEHDPYLMNSAQTMPVFTPSMGHILDADVFIIASELAKQTSSAEADLDMVRTMIHEFGHVLGLFHKALPDMKNADGTSDTTPSIMSYDSNITDLQPYDIEAIQALYPLKPTGP